MAFGQEVKDFINGARAVQDMSYKSTMQDYYKQKIDNAFDYGNTPDPVTGMTPDQVNGKPKRHSALHNVGRLLGLTSDNPSAVTVAQPGAVPSAIPDPNATQAPVSRVADTSAIDTGSSGSDDDDDPTQYYARGGRVQKFADGGVVQPTDDDDDTPDAPTTPAPQAIPAPTPSPSPALPAAPAQPPAPAAVPQQTASSDTLGDALHGGLTTLAKWFNLDQPDGAVGGPTPQKQAGKMALMKSVGRPSDQDYAAAANAVDPDKQLNSAQVNLRVMEKGYEYYMQRGEPDKANNYAASIIQYATYEASKHGVNALQALKSGDLQGAAANLQQGYNSIPNGSTAAGFTVNPDNTVTAVQADTTTGKPIEQHTLTGQDLYAAALGLANKSSTWKVLMDAAAARKGVQRQPRALSDSDAGIIAGVAGQNPDGSPAASALSANTIDPDKTQIVTGDGASAAIKSLPAYQQAYAAAMAKGESSDNPAAKNGSSVGLFQFTPDTWKNATGQTIPANVIGTPQDPRLDPAKSAQAMRTLTAKNETVYRSKFDKDPTPQDLAVMHQQGTTGGIRLLSADPNSPAAKYVSTAALKQNGIDPKATAGQAVQQIQQFYFGKGSPGSSQVSSQSQNGLDPTLPEDEAPAAPTLSMPTAPGAPQYVHPNGADMAKLSTPEARRLYMQTIQRQNLELQKQHQDAMSQYTKDAQAAQTQYRTDMSQYTAAQKAARGAAATPAAKRGDVETALSAAESSPAVTKLFASDENDVSKPQMDGAKPVAYALYAHNDMTSEQAYRAAASLVTPGQKNFTAHSMPNGNVRIVMKGDGSKFVIPANAYSQIAAVRGTALAAQKQRDQTAAANVARWQGVGQKGKNAIQAAGRIMDNTRKPVDKGSIVGPTGAF